jgi:hypothetical protein
VNGVLANRRRLPSRDIVYLPTIQRTLRPRHNNRGFRASLHHTFSSQKCLSPSVQFVATIVSFLSPYTPYYYPRSLSRYHRRSDLLDLPSVRVQNFRQLPGQTTWFISEHTKKIPTDPFSPQSNISSACLRCILLGSLIRRSSSNAAVSAKAVFSRCFSKLVWSCFLPAATKPDEEGNDHDEENRDQQAPPIPLLPCHHDEED